jgi:hypothetical protein
MVVNFKVLPSVLLYLYVKDSSLLEEFGTKDGTEVIHVMDKIVLILSLRDTTS